MGDPGCESGAPAFAAGEVLETVEEFPSMKQPRDGVLRDRRVVICDTLWMPPAARKAPQIHAEGPVYLVGEVLPCG